MTAPDPNQNPGELLPLLEKGEISLEGQFVWGSNYTLLVNVTNGSQHTQAVYKPTQGERPLWDFPAETLGLREAAAYQVSAFLQWPLVPPTVYRRDGPMGPGSLQAFIEHDPEYHFFTFSESDRARLRPVALFDLVINNADRKGGHLLVDSQGQIWAIDHGICFHEMPKLRTVIWDFVDEPLPPELCTGLEQLRDQLSAGSALEQRLLACLSAGELRAMQRRVDRILTRQKFPPPPRNSRPYPWPLI